VGIARALGMRRVTDACAGLVLLFDAILSRTVLRSCACRPACLHKQQICQKQQHQICQEQSRLPGSWSTSTVVSRSMRTSYVDYLRRDLDLRFSGSPAGGTADCQSRCSSAKPVAAVSAHTHTLCHDGRHCLTNALCHFAVCKSLRIPSL